jgi:hypothetical protein
MDLVRARNGRKESPDAGFVPEGARLAVHFLESLAFISKIQDTVVEKFRAALWMFLAKFREPACKFVTNFRHCFPPGGDPIKIIFLAHTARDRSIHIEELQLEIARFSVERGAQISGNLTQPAVGFVQRLAGYGENV